MEWILAELFLTSTLPVNSQAVEMAERSTADALDLAFRHADSPTFEGGSPGLRRPGTAYRWGISAVRRAGLKGEPWVGAAGGVAPEIAVWGLLPFCRAGPPECRLSPAQFPCVNIGSRRAT